MTANALIHAAPGWAQGELLTPTQVNAIDAAQARAVSRIGTASGTRYFPLRPVQTIGTAGARICTPAYGVLSCNNVTDDLWFFLDELPHGHRLTGVGMYIKPTNGHSGQPAVLPSIHVYTIDGLGSNTLLGDGTYTWVDLSTYDAGIYLNIPTLAAHYIDRTSWTYLVKVILESGTNSISAMSIKSLYATCAIDHANGGTDISIWG